MISQGFTVSLAPLNSDPNAVVGWAKVPMGIPPAKAMVALVGSIGSAAGTGASPAVGPRRSPSQAIIPNTMLPATTGIRIQRLGIPCFIDIPRRSFLDEKEQGAPHHRAAGGHRRVLIRQRTSRQSCGRRRSPGPHPDVV
jgi:hypothetical protein